ncbi:MAG: DNA starvation/stationary phase protection protein [Micavibrio sp.]|nr:DNA starvation/stationary phase protection protein [Micavibrio sp.]|tara:strand:+ start:3072 stop:3515 length:444 start_codon:yes stop_codon:yes gene_type:complete
MSNKDVANALKAVLADTFVLYFKTHSFHWNVTGPHFKSLHELFEEQYNEIWAATDEIAERIRTLGEFAPNNYDEMAKIATLTPSGQTPDEQSMVQILADDNRAIVKTLYNALKTAENDNDEATVDLMVERISTHEKAAWMLESSRAK